MPNTPPQTDNCTVRVIKEETPVTRDISVYVPEKIRKPGEAAFAGLITAIGVLGYYLAMDLSSDSLSAPSVFPKIASTVIFCGGVISLLRAIRRERPPSGETAWQYLMPSDVQGMLALMSAYCLVLPHLHFPVSSYIFLVAGMTLLYRGKHIIRSSLYSALILVCLILIFRYVMLVILP